MSFEEIRVPPLRERPGDAALQAAHFLQAFTREVPSLVARTLTPAAIDTLASHPFPGNVRELENLVERAAYRADQPAIQLRDLGFDGDYRPPCPQAAGGFSQAVETNKRKLVMDALHQAGGSQAQAARDLALSYDQVRYYVRKYRQG